MIHFFNKAYSIETKIIHRIQNEIITNIDIKNEFKYLMALNNTLKKLDNEKILSISNNSIIKEKIKKIEISKHFKIMEIKEDYKNFLIKDIYSRLNLKSVNEFEIYLKDYDLILDDIERRLTINALWNQLIIKKYSSQININENQIRKQILENNYTQTKEYKLSEIIFEVENKKEIKNKYREIINNIGDVGFENSALIYSISQSAKNGGDIGWISEKSLNNKIKKSIKFLKIGEISEPIILSTGILLLKVVDSKNSKININQEVEFKKAVAYERNRQLNQYSKIYYNKIKKNLEFDG
ncbi:peptidylprolyl isomerase [Candidatus Pelagibacter sp.]|nr:peptidylprolyl isomerase [Candidatus Pelagibacter sp.]